MIALTKNNDDFDDDNFHSDLYDISYVWYGCIGSSLVVIVALFSSCLVSSQVLNIMLMYLIFVTHAKKTDKYQVYIMLMPFSFLLC